MRWPVAAVICKFATRTVRANCGVRRIAVKVFMLGWEFPPFISGGLGTACYGLTKAMSKLGTEIVFVLGLFR